MIGRDAIANQAVRRGQPVINVDRHRQVGSDQRVRRVDPGGAGSHDRYPEGTIHLVSHALPNFPRTSFWLHLCDFPP